jgi:hypothetical protein
LLTSNVTNKFSSISRRILPKNGLPYWGAALDVKKKFKFQS